MNYWLAIFTTLTAALILTLLPMPEWTVWLRPAWVLMVLIFWNMMLPNRVGMGIAWLTGLAVDLLTGTLLGEHALAYTLIIYFVDRIHIRLRIAPLVQQGLTIFGFILAYQFLIYCMQGFIGDIPRSHLYWAASLTSLILWPWLFVLMRDFTRWFKMV